MGDKYVIDNETIYGAKLDTTIPKMELKVYYHPTSLGMDETWDLQGSAEYTANYGFIMDYKLTKDSQVVSQGEGAFDIKANDANKFELESSQKITMTEQSYLYGLTETIYGEHFNEAEKHFTVIVDKTKKQWFLIPGMTLKSNVTIDGQKIREIEFDNIKDVSALNVYWAPGITSLKHGTQYKLSLIQKGVFPKGLQTTFSTIGTYLVATVHTALSEEANVVVV